MRGIISVLTGVFSQNPGNNDVITVSITEYPVLSWKVGGWDGFSVSGHDNIVYQQVSLSKYFIIAPYFESKYPVSGQTF